MLVDMLNNFEAYVSEINMGGLSFEVLVHACRTEMVEYGKYYSVVSVELVGSRERVWAVVVRWYDLAYCSQKVTVMMNPYHDFLQGAIRATQEEKATIVRNLLVGESVRETFNWIKKNNRLDRRLNLFEYLNANKMI